MSFQLKLIRTEKKTERIVSSQVVKHLQNNVNGKQFLISKVCKELHYVSRLLASFSF